MSRATVADGWGESLRWTRGLDYDADGRDELLIYDTISGKAELLRRNPPSTLLEKRAAGEFKDALLYPGYFRGRDRASVLISHRVSNDHHPLEWLQFDRLGAPSLLTPLKPFVSEGTVVVIGNFFQE